MPVMIWTNSATELCITCGQEGTVYCWQAAKGLSGQRVLDTLFVKLINPPQVIQFDGLSENVVPITRTSVTVDCSLPDDSYITIS